MDQLGVRLTSGCRRPLLALAAMLFACSQTVLVSVPPRMDLQRYPTLGIVEFASNSGRAIGARAARQFQEQIRSAQPGTRIVELGDRDALLAELGGTQLDMVWSRSAWATRQIGSFQVSAETGVSGGMKDSNPREAMLPALAHQLTHDFRPTTERQPAK